MNLTTDQAYLIGLLIGGGNLSNQHLSINLPYKEWGDYTLHPNRGGTIAEDILRRIKPIWEQCYEMNISYRAMEKSWQIIASTLSKSLLNDLTRFGLPITGEFREYATLEKLIPFLDNSEKIKQLLAGLTFVAGSFTESHRRFTNEFQIVSYELNGNNFKLVSQLYELFKQINCEPDQVLWQHPNQHCGLDRYYKTWTSKGFKIRVGLSDYILYGTFLDLAKQKSALENLALQSNDNSSSTQGKAIRIDKRSCLHQDESSDFLVDYIRGYHFIHNAHFTAFLGGSLTDAQRKELLSAINNAEKFVSPFTILTKKTISEIEAIIQEEPYLKQSVYSLVDITINDLISTYKSNKHKVLWGTNQTNGFPIGKIMQAISFLFSKTTGKNINEGDSTRVKGNYMNNIYEHLKEGYDIQIDYLIPNRGTCMILKTDTHACLIGYRNDEFSKTLITREGEYGLKIREPLYEECVELA